MRDNPRIGITRTPGEWQLIEKKIKKMERSDVKKYIQGSAFKLEKQFKECPGCFTPGGGRPVQRQFYIPIETHNVLAKLSEITNRPISSILDELFIAPLLLPEKK